MGQAAQYKYLASDLVELLGVPRSTVNDWLQRYGDYLEYELRGKRKVFSEKSLKVLEEIRTMRNAGESLSGVENKLQEEYGIRPEVAAQKEEPVPENTDTQRISIVKAPAENLPAELQRQMNAHVENIFNEILKNETRNKIVLKDVHFSLLAVALLVVFSCALTAAILYLAMTHGAERMESYYQQTGKILRQIDLGNSDLQKKLESQQKEAAGQKAEFVRQLKAMEQSSAKRLDAELKLIRSDFEKRLQSERKTLEAAHKTKMEAVSAALAEAQSAKKNAEDECFALRKKLSEKPAAPATPAAPAVKK